ncbi:MAG: hypothetical protein WCR51_02060 [Planctomycetia bacterium]
MASMADKRRQAAALAAERNRQGAGGRIVKRGLAVLLVLLLLALPTLWALGFFSSPQAVAEVKQLVDQQVAEYDRVARGEVPFASAPSFGAMMETMRDVPREYRDQVGQQMGRLWEARERAELMSYFKLPPAQRQAELDRRIKADEARRKAWQAERDKRDQARAAENPQAAGSAQGGDRGGRGPGGGGQGGGQGGGGQPGGGRTEDGRNARSKGRIDRTTPEQRAQQAEYRRAMDARRKELGLPTGGRRGG